MSDKQRQQVVERARRFVAQRFPDASLVLLCGSWARGDAHEDSDLDLFIVDATVPDLLFEGLRFEEMIIEVCALAPQRVEPFFTGSAQHRSAPVPRQVLDGLVVHGEPRYAAQIKNCAQRILAAGPQALDEPELLELRWRLTALLNDLAHVPTDEVPALAAQCHTQLALAAIDRERGWRGERKTLRRALAEVAPDLVARLDEGLVTACGGDRQQLLTIGRELLAKLGGSQRTYLERY